MLVQILGAILAGYLILVIGTALFQRALIYHPGKLRQEPAEAGLPEMIAVPVRAADGWMATGWYAPPQGSRAPTVVLFHGNAGTIGDRARKARAFIDAGCGVFLATYRGYGANHGHPSEEGLYRDARAVMGWLITRGVPESRVVIYGESLGSGVAVQMATEREVGALILEAPFTSLVDLAPPFIFSPLARMLMQDRFDNLAKIGPLLMPLLVIHGEQDDLVPVAMGRRLLAANDAIKESLFVADAGHNDVWDKGGETAAIDFIRRRLGG